MPDNDDGLIRPRHRKKGRASKRGTDTPGRHLRVVPDPAEQDAPLGHYPVDDLAAMSPSAVEMLVHRARLEAESMAASIPHVLITRDTETGVATTSEPFVDGLHALVTASEFVEKYRDLQPRWDFTLTVAPVPG